VGRSKNTSVLYAVESECEGALQESSVRLLVGILQVPHTLFLQKVAKVAKARSGSLVVTVAENGLYVSSLRD
jgi:hypothetical protein